MVEQAPYLALCVAAVVVSVCAPAHHRPFCMGAAIWLLCDNIIYNLTWDGRDLVTPEWWPALTLAFFGVMTLMLWVECALWKLAVLFVTALQGLAHLLFWGVGDTSAGAWFIYTKALDLTFVGQVACVSWEGTRGAWISYFARRVDDRGRGARPPDFDGLAQWAIRLARVARSAFKAER